MKLSNLLIAITQITLAMSAHDTSPSADDERGTVNATDFATNNLVKRDPCWWGEPYGCSDTGFCWRTCGSQGEWCWLAANNGNGAWLTCGSAAQCAPGSVGSAGCGKGDCKACGCGCTK